MIDDAMINQLARQCGAVVDNYYGNSAFTPDALRSFSQACYAAGREELATQQDHTPVEPEEVYSPNTVILKA